MKLEDIDAREHESKAKWHYSRAGKHANASLSKGIKHDYEAQLLRRGVKDSQGEHTSMEREEPKNKPVRHTRVLNVSAPGVRPGVGVKDDAELYAFR